MATYRLTFLTLPLAVASVALGACGGGSDDATAGTGDRRAEFREAALKFAKCMRAHGVDMPDPTPGGGIQIGAPDMSPQDQQKMEDAQRACQEILEKVRPPELSEEDQQKFKDQALEFARCMRKHGIDFPDPQFQGGGRMMQRLDEGADPNSQRFQDAEKACANGRGGAMTIGPGGPDGP